MDIKKYIYFPPSHVPHRAPRVVFISENWGGDLKGAEHEEDLKEGRFRFFPYKRCQIFSPRLWEDCLQWTLERDQVESKFDQLMKKGVILTNEPEPESLPVSDL